MKKNLFIVLLLTSFMLQSAHRQPTYVASARMDEIIGFNYTQDLYNFFDLKKPAEDNAESIKKFKNDLMVAFKKEYPRYVQADFKVGTLPYKKIPEIQRHIENGFNILYADQARKKYNEEKDKNSSNTEYVRKFVLAATPQERQEIAAVLQSLKALPEEQKQPAVQLKPLSPVEIKEVELSLGLLGQSLASLNYHVSQKPTTTQAAPVVAQTTEQLNAILAQRFAPRRGSLEEDED